MTGFTRSALLFAFLAAPLAGCGHDADAPSMVTGQDEVAKQLPKEENHKLSAKAKRLKAATAAGSVQLQQ